MKKQQVDHVLRAAGRITGEKQFILVTEFARYMHGYCWRVSRLWAPVQYIRFLDLFVGCQAIGGAGLMPLSLPTSHRS